MNNKNKAESLVGIIIGVFILSFILIGMINVIGFSKDISFNYENKIEENLIETNSKNIILKLNTDTINTQENFYVFKDNINKEFKIMTGSINEDKYQYIDKYGYNTSSGTEIKIFKRTYQKKIDILRHVIYPTEIDNLIFHFDATNIDGDGNEDNEPNDGDSISIWKDLSKNNINAEASSGDEVSYKSNSINNKPTLIFNDSLLQIPYDSSNNDNNELSIIINNDGDCYAQKTYTEKSFAIVLKTGQDITTDQTIYEQGGQATGYNFMIHDGNIYAGVYNKADDSYSCTDYSSSDSTFYYEWDNDGSGDHRFKSVNLGEALPETVYFIQIVQDSTHLIDNGTPKPDTIDEQNKLQIYLNGNLVMDQDHVDPMPEHWKAGIGAVNEYSVEPRSPFDTINDTKGKFFKGEIGEFISWNHALTQEEVIGVQNYFVDKWLGGIESVRHNIIETNVSLIK